MTTDILVLIATGKGAFILEGDTNRRDFALKGPFCDAQSVNHVIADPATGTLYAGGGDGWVGPAVWRSTDRGQSWTRFDQGLAYPDGQDKLKAVWSLARAHGRLYAGVEPAGLFMSEDDGETWHHVQGLTDHPTRPEWVPGGGGLILHHIVAHPTDPGQLWVGISTAGVFHTADGGKSWTPRNQGTRCDFMGDGATYPEYGQCVHSLAMAPGDGSLLYQQNHCGMYKSTDGGQSWTSVENGLPSDFGFATATHPRDPETAYLLPLVGAEKRYAPDGKLAVWRTRDGGQTWQDLRQGLPQSGAYLCVLRQAMATDPLTPAGIYFGTTGGTLFASPDEGESWTTIAQHLPAIRAVETLVASR
jgi:photosystem II stability/assembly factor-like uncharacterized protein